MVRFLLGTVQTHHCYIIFIATCALTDIAQLLFISSVRKLRAPPHDGRRVRCALWDGVPFPRWRRNRRNVLRSGDLHHMIIPG